MSQNPEPARFSSNSPVGAFLRQMAASYRDECSDAELLAQYLKTGEQDAFRALVARHGRSVWIACLGQVGDSHDAEDAFQAAFVALARQGANVDAHAGLGPWLRAAARRAARKLRRSEGRLGRLREKLRAEMPESGTVPGWGTNESRTWQLASEELERLPERLRVPVVMYNLEGRTYAQIAELLQCSTAGVHRRVERGLKLLRERLSNRGVVLTTGLLVAVPTGLTSRAARAAFSAASPRVSVLADAILAPRFPTAWIAAGLALVATGTALIARPSLRPSASPTAQTIAMPITAPIPKSISPIVRHGSSVTALAVSLNGQRVASVGADHLARVWDRDTGREVNQFRTSQDPVTAIGFRPNPDPNFNDLLTEDPIVGLALWDIMKPGHRRKNWHGQPSGIDALAFSADGRRLVTIGRDGKITAIDLSRPQREQRDADWEEKERRARTAWREKKVPLESGAGFAAAFTSDSKSILVLDRKLQLTRRDVASGLEENVKWTASPKLPVSTVGISPNGAWAVWGNGDNDIGFLDVERAKVVGFLSGPKAPVVSLVVSADGLSVASADTSGQILRWIRPNLVTPFESGKCGSCRGAVLALSPDGKQLYAAGTAGDVFGWDTATLAPLEPSTGEVR